MELLTEENFVLYAAKNYDNPQCFSEEEFFRDLKLIKYIKRGFNKFEETGEIKHRLILNHIIVLTNLFGVGPASRMLFFRLDGQFNLLKPFLEFLGFLPEVVAFGNPIKYVKASDIISDEYITSLLKEI